MPWNGSGQFTRNYSWVNDAANSIPITAPRVDNDTNDIVGNGFGNTLTRDGQGSATANLPMNGFKHTNCAPGVNSTDYATFGQVSILAPLASPAFTGTPTGPTAAAGTNTTQLATTSFVVTSYLPLAGGSMTGPITLNAGTLGSGAGSGATLQQLGLNDNNHDSIVSQAFRSTSGSTFAGVVQQIFRLVDATVMGIIQFGDGNGNASFGLGLGFASQSLLCTTSNAWSTTGAFTSGGTLTANGSFSYGAAGVQPHIFVQSGTPTAVAVGDLWFF
jgi:hypothetical protein